MMVSFFSKKQTPPPPPPSGARPQLELSGPVLTSALEGMVAACESAGGVERFVDAVKMKSAVFQNAFGEDHGAGIGADEFAQICGLMPTVRRRIGPHLEDGAYGMLQGAIAQLFDNGDVDTRLANLCTAYPEDKHHRWVKDLGAEILHNTDPERYPLMCRWVWDRKANSGVIREIWYGDADHMTLDVDDGYETFLMLREELSQFLTANGVFQDIISYVDLLCAKIYAEYVSAQGGSYLKTDFTGEEDPAKHLRRLLGIDGVRAKTDRKLSSIDGAAVLVDQAKLLTGGHR